MTTRKAGLGRNLNMLLSNTGVATKTEKESERLANIDINQLRPGVYQPRQGFPEESLIELSQSIKQQGLLQPIVVRQIKKDCYEIIAGERRYRASKLAGLSSVPAIIHQVDDKTSLAFALVENIQRENLNPMDEARALSRLVEEFDLTHQQAADIVSKSRASVSNLLRLMHLHADVQRMLENGDIEMGHARALLSLELSEQLKLAREITARELTVRDVEAIIKRQQRQETKQVDISGHQIEARARQKTLSKQLGVKVQVKPTQKGKFKVSFEYGSLDALDLLIDKMIE
jgi:ParB family chromosome partitioning protein